jgi:hypothetical protein
MDLKIENFVFRKNNILIFKRLFSITKKVMIVHLLLLLYIQICQKIYTIQNLFSMGDWMSNLSFVFAFACSIDLMTWAMQIWNCANEKKRLEEKDSLSKCCEWVGMRRWMRSWGQTLKELESSDEGIQIRFRWIFL